jgi:hypothetical protein
MFREGQSKFQISFLAERTLIGPKRHHAGLQIYTVSPVAKAFAKVRNGAGFHKTANPRYLTSIYLSQLVSKERIIMPLDQRQRHPRRHQRLQSRASHCHFIFVLMLTCYWLLTSSVVQAVLTEDDIINKELTWAAMARRVHQSGFYVGAPATKGASKTTNDSDNDIDVNNDDFDWTRDDYDWTQQQRQQDRIQLQLQKEDKPRRRQQLRSRRRRNVEMSSNRANLRDRSDAPLSR